MPLISFRCYNKLLSEIPEPDAVILMGCNVGCPITNAGIVEDWGLEDPSGKDDEAFIETIQKIEGKILDLKSRLKIYNMIKAPTRSRGR